MQYFKTPRLFQWIFPRRTWGFSSSDNSVYLTFDDGPCPVVTPWILEVLEKEGVKACFFCVGQNAENHPEILEQIIGQGHQIGNHTFAHEKGTRSSWKDYRNSIQKTDEILNTKYFRPPYGRIRFWQSFLLSFRYQIVMWTWLSYDYDRRVSIDKIMQEAERIKAGDILLLHDNAKMEDRIKELLPQLLKHLKSKGFSFAKLP